MSLFILHQWINQSIPDQVKSSVRLFADDTIMYLTVASQNDANQLQSDLQRLAMWETLWKMKFHPEKCQVITISRCRKNIYHDYTLHGHSLEHVKSVKYLVLTITQDLRWNKHVNNITSKEIIFYPSSNEIYKWTILGWKQLRTILSSTPS